MNNVQLYFKFFFSSVGYSSAKPQIPIVSGIIGEIGKNFLDSILKSSGVLDLFKEQDKYIPSDEFKDVIQKLDQFKNSYSPRAADLAGEVKTLLNDALDTYFMAANSVYEWCGVAMKRLEQYNYYLANLTRFKIKLQHKIIIQVLEEGIKRMTEAQKSLDIASRSFNKAAGQIVSLTAQLNDDFNTESQYTKLELTRLEKEKNDAKSCIFWFCWENSKTRTIDELKNLLNEKLKGVKKFHDDVKDALVQADKKIVETKQKLRDEITAIGEVKAQTEVTLQTIDDIKDAELEDYKDGDLQKTIKKQVDSLIEECRKYRARHNDSKESLQSNNVNIH